MEERILYNEIRMLEGNINRMCIADSREELDKMYEFALLRLERIKKLNLSRFDIDDLPFKED